MRQQLSTEPLAFTQPLLGHDKVEVISEHFLNHTVLPSCVGCRPDELQDDLRRTIDRGYDSTPLAISTWQRPRELVRALDASTNT